MSIFVSEPQGGYEPIPAGTYPASCYLVADIGEHWQTPLEKGKEGRWQRQIILGWELQGVGDAADEKIYTIHKFYSATLGRNSNLRADLENWRGREFTPEELKQFDLSSILSAPCLLQIATKTKQNGESRDAVAGILRLPKGMQAAAPSQSIEFSIERDMAQLEFLPKLVQSCVKNSREYQEKFTAAPSPFAEEEAPPLPEEDPFGGVLPF